MKNINFLFTGLLFCAFSFVNAQTSQIGWTFDDGDASFAVINMNAADPSYTLSVTDGILKVEVNKKVNDWSFMQQYNMGLDLSTLPTLQFKVRSEGGAKINFTLKDTNDETVMVAHTPTTDTEMEYVFLDLSSVFDAAPTFLKTSIKELQIEISNGWTVTTTDVVYFDFVRLGYTEELDTGGDYYNEDFETGLPPDVTSDTKYTTSASDGVMVVDVHKQNRWQPMDIGLGAVYDISSNPVVSIRLRSDDPMVLQCFLVDEDGNGFRNVFVDAQYDHYDLVSGENAFRQVKVFPDDDFTTISFDFSNADASIVDMARIMKIRLCANGTAASFNGTFYIDEIEAGKNVEKTAYIGQIDEIGIYSGMTGEQTVLIPEVRNATTVTASGAESLIKNHNVEAVTYTTFNENGYSQTYGYTHLHFELVAGAVGSDTVLLHAEGDGSFGNSTEKFVITVSENMPPHIDQPADQLAVSQEENDIVLTEISDGDPDVEQDIAFSFSSDNETVVNAGSFEYTQGYKTAHLLVSPLATGDAQITVLVTDEDEASSQVSFQLMVYEELNGVPALDQAEDISLVNNSGAAAITLTGISDGDNMTQDLAITATSSNPAIVPDPSVQYTQGEHEAVISLAPVDNETGTVNITVTVTDNGGNTKNNGDQSVQMVFEVNSIAPSVTGYVVDLNDPASLGMFGASSTYSLSIVDFQEEKALKIEMNNKSTWDGIVLHHPELNLVEHPLVSYDIYTESADPTLYHWNYYYDVNGNRNILNSNDHKYEAPVGQWTSLSFDYRQEGDMSTSEGVPIDASRIDYLLINMHSTLVGWPFTEISGVCYMKNIRLGDQAVVPEPPVYATVDPVSDQSVFADTEQFEISVTGITNGKGSIEGVTVTATSSNTDVVPDPSKGELSEEGTLILTLQPVSVGYADINIEVVAEGAEPAEVTFRVRILSTDVSEYASIHVDRSVKNQVIKGIGAFYNEPRWLDMFVTDMGASAVRLGIISNQWEPVNDNDDPNVMNMSGFNYDAFDWQYMRDMKNAGVEHFILTSWSPPAWMKRSMTTDHTNQAIQWEKTDNIMEPYYYEEFAESMAALVKAFKEEAGIDLLAIGLQNEPFFNEPYASAILGPDQFHKLIEVVGDRFAAEGLDHVGFYMPEQVFGFSSYSTEDYVIKLRTNSKADAYTDFVAVHGYDGSGVDSDFPDYSGWKSLNNFVSSGENPKELWMSETHIGYDNFSSALSLAGAMHGSLWAGNITLWTNWSFGDVQLTRNEPNSSFYATKQYARYVRPGAVRVDSDSDHPRLLVTAFENSDGSFAMVIINSGFTPVATRFEGGDLPDSYEVIRTTRYENARDVGNYTMSDGPIIFPASSITTLISYNPVQLTMNRPDDITVNSSDGEQQVVISGISNGAGDIENLVLEFQIEDPSIIEDASISAISENGEAVFTFTPDPEGEGQTKVILKLSDDLGNTKTDAFYITVVFVDGVGKIEGPQMRIFPVPSDDYIHVELPGQGFEMLRIREITGKLIAEYTLSSAHIVLDITGINPGIYFIEVEGKEGRLIEQIVIH
ncbi:MAG: T9SS type A sorting domain-containing protein [Bacteroidales bacterium]|nr:T9SS type A sorting domain-containing protein [Bacteroidales bacterium]